MANIDPYLQEISDAVYGEEVRGSIINALKKVNDDNESYIEIKNEIIQAKDDIDADLQEFSGLIEEADTKKAALSETIGEANTADESLGAKITTAGTLKDDLQALEDASGDLVAALNTAKGQAETAKENLDSSIEQGTAKKTALDESISGAGTAKQNLDGSIQTATTKKTQLDSSIEAAGTSKQALDASKQAADTAKTNLDGSITTAGETKTALDGSITEAGTKKTALDESITNAGDAKSDLDGSIETGNTLKGDLDTVNEDATENINDLTARNAAAEQNIVDLREAMQDADEILTGVEDIKAYIGYPDEDIVGVQVDLENKTFSRLAGAYGLIPGTDFDPYPMFGNRRRCNVADDGTINAYFGDAGYVEDGSNGQVMVYQPKFYYKVVPLKLEAQADGVGYHIRKANYYLSATAKEGFKLHPAFKDVNGNEVDYILLPAYEGCLYDTSAGAYLTKDEQVMNTAEDKLSSIAGVKPASGVTQQLTRPNVEILAQNRGANWHGYTIQAASANQMLMLVELAGNFQTVVGQGVVSITDSPNTTNNSSYTGSTASLGNGTGRAAETINERNGTEYTETADGKTAVSYRGMENPWGNIWDFVYGINIHGNGNQKGGIPYICTDFNFAESKNSGNYESAGFTVTNANGYISAFGYGNPDYDWLFIASETAGTSALPIGDYHYVTANLNGYRIAPLGGRWADGATAGGFSWTLDYGVGGRSRNVGGRLVYVPTAA